MSERAFAPDSIKNMAEKIAFVSFDVIQFRDNEMRSHWYRYQDIDLYYFQNLKGELAKIHITIFGQVVEWNPFDGVRTGLLIEEEGVAGVSEVVQYDSRASTACVKQALHVLRHAQKIEAVQRQQLLDCLTQKKAVPLTLFQKIIKWFVSQSRR